MSDHVHRYDMGTPSGPVSVGRCACGATREYSTANQAKTPREAHSRTITRRRTVQETDKFTVFAPGNRGFTK